MVSGEKCLPCKPDNLSLISRFNVKSGFKVVHLCNPSSLSYREVRWGWENCLENCLEVHRLASPEYTARQKQERPCLNMTKGENCLLKVVPWPPHMCMAHVHPHYYIYIKIKYTNNNNKS